MGGAGNLLEGGLFTLKRNIIGKRHERAASAVSCSLLLLLGAVLSIRLRDRSPLVVYFWSFLTAIAVVVIVNIGQRTAGDASGSLAAGLVVLWSGNAALVVGLGLLVTIPWTVCTVTAAYEDIVGLNSVAEAA